MNIGLDYGGVVDFDEDKWSLAVSFCITRRHNVFLVSHAQDGDDAMKRARFCAISRCENLTFTDLKSGQQEIEIARRKAELIRDFKIDLFIDDDRNRVFDVAIINPRCACFYVPQSNWGIGLLLVEAIGGV